MALLEVYDLYAGYGTIMVLRGASLAVERGQVMSLLGAKGAGKSITLNTIMGLLPALQGRIIFDGTNITGWRADEIAALGLVQVPEGRQIVPTMTVVENLRMGAYRRRDNAAISADLDEIFERFPRLEAHRYQKAGSLSSSEQQFLALSRALMARPRLLLLDEPGAGLSPPMVNEVYQLIADIKAQGIPVLLAEQDAQRALQAADYAYVLSGGTVAHQGRTETLRQNPGIISAYLG